MEGTHFVTSRHQGYPASTMTLRTVQNTGGLFNSESANEGGFSLADIQTPDVALTSTINEADLFTMVQDCQDSEVPQTPQEFVLMAPYVETVSSAGESSKDQDMIYLDSFLDLTDYHSAEGEAGLSSSAIMVSSDSQSNVQLGRKMPTKRTAISTVPSTSTTPFNPDHNDYTSKPYKMARADRPSTSSETSCSDYTVTSTSGDAKEKYTQRRNKNNIASRRSRQTRKQKFASNEQRAIDLEVSNAHLESRIIELTKLTQLMKDTLVSKIAVKQ